MKTRSLALDISRVDRGLTVSVVTPISNVEGSVISGIFKVGRPGENGFIPRESHMLSENSRPVYTTTYAGLLRKSATLTQLQSLNWGIINERNENCLNSMRLHIDKKIIQVRNR